MSGKLPHLRRAPASMMLTGLLLAAMAGAQQLPSAPAVPVGTAPPAASVPRLEFAFEFRVTLAPATVLGETPYGRRQYIPITGGVIAGPKFSGEIIQGGWDYQLGLPEGCGTLSADYFIRANDGAVIHVLNEGFNCGLTGPDGQRSFFRPRFEAPKGPHDWLTRATFVATLELDRTAAPPAGAPPGTLGAIRIKFYQVR